MFLVNDYRSAKIFCNKYGLLSVRPNMCLILFILSLLIHNGVPRGVKLCLHSGLSPKVTLTFLDLGLTKKEGSC